MNLFSDYVSFPCMAVVGTFGMAKMIVVICGLEFRYAFQQFPFTNSSEGSTWVAFSQDHH